jgi:His/Glu/Gln/Arg/opine family amino acid ABC transporter permease subunit
MDINIIVESLPRLLKGALLTLELTGISLGLGLFLAIALAFMCVSKKKWIRLPVTCFNFYFRGTPLLVQIFLIYYGSGQFQAFLDQAGLWIFFREAYFCAILALMLNTAAYTAEILRGGIEAIPASEIEAAYAFGYSGIRLKRRIILPKAFRIAWPAYTNEVVFLLQASSLVSIITLMDLTGVARVIAARSFAFYEIFITTALIYLIIVYGVLFCLKRIERRINNYLYL